MRAECALAVGNMGVAAAKFEDKLSALLDDRQPMVVAAACTALGSLAHSTGASASAAKISECLDSQHPAVEAAAIEALGKLGEEEAVAYLDDFAKAIHAP